MGNSTGKNGVIRSDFLIVFSGSCGRIGVTRDCDVCVGSKVKRKTSADNSVFAPVEY